MYKLLIASMLIFMSMASLSQNIVDASFKRRVQVLTDWKFLGSNDPVNASGVRFNDKKWTRVSLPHSWVTGTHNRNLRNEFQTPE